MEETKRRKGGEEKVRENVVREHGGGGKSQRRAEGRRPVKDKTQNVREEKKLRKKSPCLYLRSKTSASV